MSNPAGGNAAPSRRPVLVGLLLFALTLRGPFVVVSTVTDELNSQLGMSATTIGLLTSLPVLCFGLAAPGASVLIARLGVERSVLASLLGTFVGVLIRSIGGVPGALIGTLIIGLAITVGNVVSPVIIGRDFYGRAATVTGVYTGALNVGTMLTLTATGPLVTRFGWQIALAAWAVLPVIAAVVWVPLAQRRAADRARQKAAPPAHGNRPADSPPPARLTTLLRRPSTWLLTGAFAGQAFAYYGLTAWLPTLLADEQGMNRDQASASSSIFQICALIGALGAPIIINRLGGPLSAFLIFGALWSTMPLGLLFASDLWALWSALSGVAQGGGFVAVFTVVVLRAATQRENRQLSAIVQTGGYVVASLGPVILGALNESTGAWDASLLAALLAICALTTLGSLSTRGLRR